MLATSTAPLVLGGHPKESLLLDSVLPRPFPGGGEENPDVHVDLAAFREVFCADLRPGRPPCSPPPSGPRTTRGPHHRHPAGPAAPWNSSRARCPSRTRCGRLPPTPP
ncbi:hypothetical protein GCM10009528_05270 [Kineococcus aurantiacus]